MAVTPLAVDEYSRFMVDLFDEKDVVSVSTGFQAFFGVPETGAKTVFSPNSEVVEIDIMRANERIAALLPRNSLSRDLTGQKDTQTQEYTTFSRVYPWSKEVGNITAGQINKRLAGENPYDQIARSDRLMELAQEHHMEHVRRNVRMFEYLSSQAIREGVMDAIIGTSNTDLQYDYRRLATHNFTPAVKWDNASNTIIDDVDTSCDLVRADGKVRPDMMILGGGMMDAFINDSDVQTQADNRRFELIEVSTNNPVPPRYNRFVNAGFIPRGRLRTPKGYELWMFTYVDGYTNSSGTYTPYMPTDEVVICNCMARCDRYFGPPESMPIDSFDAQWMQEVFGINPNAPAMPQNIKGLGSVVSPNMFYFDAYKGEGNTTYSIRTQTAPIFATTMTDAFVTIENGLT
jgi:hypothetical protein